MKIKKKNKKNTAPAMLPENVLKLVEDFRDYGTNVMGFFYERETVMETLMVTALLGEHILLVGEPGTTKSLIAKTFMRNFAGVSEDEEFFQCQFSAGITEESVFGPVNIKKLRESGVMEHNIRGMLPTAKMAFLDEIMDGSDVILRSLLEILNERRYSKPPQNVDVPLHFSVCTSNFMKVTDNLSAVLDRILFKVDVDYIKDGETRLAYYESSAKGFKTVRGAYMLDKKDRFEFDDLLTLSKALDLVKVPTDVLKKYDELQKELHTQLKLKKPFSDRRLGKLIGVIKASALLCGRAEAKYEDLEMLKMGLVNPGVEEDSAVFESVYQKLVIGPIKEVAVENAINETQAKIGQYLTMDFNAPSELANNKMRLKRIEELKVEFESRVKTEGSPNQEVEERVRTTMDQFKQAINTLRKKGA